MKTKEELEVLKKECEKMNKKIHELNDKELELIFGAGGNGKASRMIEEGDIFYDDYTFPVVTRYCALQYYYDGNPEYEVRCEVSEESFETGQTRKRGIQGIALKRLLLMRRG